MHPGSCSIGIIIKMAHLSLLSLGMCFIPQSGTALASQADVFRGACISSLPTNACLIENNVPFPLFYSHGK